MIKKIPIRVWILLIVLILALLAINPSPWVEGVQIKTIKSGSIAADNGLAVGQIIKTINGVSIESRKDFNKEFAKLKVDPKKIIVETDGGKSYTYNVTSEIGFSLDSNLTVSSSEYFSPLEKGMKIKKVNNLKINNLSHFKEQAKLLLPKNTVKIKTNKIQAAFLIRGQPEITVGEAAKSNIQKGLDLSGGTRVLLKPIAKVNQTISDKDISDLIKVISNRMNVYGLSDLKVRSAKDREGQKYVLIEIAGATREEVRSLIAKQGVFEAKIGNATVFEGGKRDVPFVCRDDGSCSGIRSCAQSGPNQWSCKFEFVIHLSPSAAKKHAVVTNKLDIVSSKSGKDILSENIDFYLDGKRVDSLQISSDLKGSETTSIAISGPGVGPTKSAAAQTALSNMDNMQTILITGSLPFNIEVVKLDSISPVLGKSFIKNAILVGIMALLAVAIVIFIRYRNFKILLPMIFTTLSEVFIILGFAAIIQWRLDIAAIAGILAAIGTGVDDQIVIIDEAVTGESRYSNWKQKIKRAFFIIMVAYATTVAAMLPLWNAGAGLVRGFALTTIAGVTIGVFLTRPAFAAIVERFFK